MEVTLTVKMSDSDYRVRTVSAIYFLMFSSLTNLLYQTAIESLVEYFKVNITGGVRVDRLTIYSRAAIALQDDVEDVRLAAMNLLK